MGMAKTYYHIWRHNHPLTSYFRVPRVPGFWLIAISVINPRVTEVVFTNLAKFMFINKLILAGLNQNSINNIIKTTYCTRKGITIPPRIYLPVLKRSWEICHLVRGFLLGIIKLDLPLCSKLWNIPFIFQKHPHYTLMAIYCHNWLFPWDSVHSIHWATQ